MDWQGRDDGRNADPDWQTDWQRGHEIGSLIVVGLALVSRRQHSLVWLGDAGCSGALPRVVLIILNYVRTCGPSTRIYFLQVFRGDMPRWPPGRLLNIYLKWRALRSYLEAKRLGRVGSTRVAKVVHHPRQFNEGFTSSESLWRFAIHLQYHRSLQDIDEPGCWMGVATGSTSSRDVGNP